MCLNMYILILLGLFIEAESYVLLQVRKQDNNFSNVDALIHKVVPSDKVDQIANKFGAKPLTELKDTKVVTKEDSVAKSAEKIEKNVKKENDFADNIEKMILKFVKKDKPMFRSQSEYVAPKFINFRNGKPSIIFEINSKAIVRTLKDVLSSKTFQTYMEKFAKKAGVVYRAIRDEIDKDYYK